MIRFDDVHREIRDMVADFSKNELAPRAASVDEQSAFPRRSIEQLAELGLLGAPFPERYAGANGDMRMVVLTLEELAYGCGATALVVASHLVPAGLAILDHGSESQREKWLPALASGKILACFVGFDDGSVTVIQEGDRWILDGTQAAVPNAVHADLLVVLARPAAGGGDAESHLFLVEKERAAEAVRVVGTEHALGLRGAGLAAVSFDGCRLTDADRLGDRGDDGQAISRSIAGARLGIAAIATGVARAASDYAREYAHQRQAFGRTIDRFGAIRSMMADAATEVEAARLLTYHCAVLRDDGASIAKEASMAKLFATATAYRAAKNAVQILGGNGFSREYPIERMYRDAKTLEVLEATGDRHREFIARSLIGDG